MAIVKDLGMVTAYAYAVAGGYEGTEAEFEQMLGQAGITLEQLENLTAVATTLSEGSEATASYSDGVLTFGIPRGNTGATGPQGPQGVQGETGNGIVSITKTSTSGLVDTYTITFTDGTTTTFTVTNGADGDITNVAQAFDATKAYSVGDMVLYQGTLYAFTAAHPVGAWAGSDAQAVILADEVTELKDDLRQFEDKVLIISTQDLNTWYQGASSWSNGSNQTNANIIRTDFIEVKEGYNNIEWDSTQYIVRLMVYTSNTISSYSQALSKNFDDFAAINGDISSLVGKYIKLNAGRVEAAPFSPADVQSGDFSLTFSTFTDTTLTVSGKSADAKATGDAIGNLNDVIGVPVSGTFTKPTSGNAVKSVEFGVVAGKSIALRWELENGVASKGIESANFYTRQTSSGENLEQIATNVHPGGIVVVTPTYNASFVRISATNSGTMFVNYAEALTQKTDILKQDTEELDRIVSRLPLVRFDFGHNMYDASDIVTEFGLTVENRNTVMSKVYDYFHALSVDYPSYVTEVLDAVDGIDGNTSTGLTYPWYAEDGVEAGSIHEIVVAVDSEGIPTQTINYTFTSAVTPYKVRLYKLTDTNSALPSTGKKKAFIVGGTHGNEVVAPIDICILAKRLCEPTDDPDLLKLRASFDFYIIPYLNGFGCQYLSRVNGNLVDINRNFPTSGWAKTTITETTFSNLALCTFSGKSAGSEFETQLIMALYNQIKPDAFIDHHNSSTGASQFYTITPSAYVGNAIYEALNDCAYAFIHNYPAYFGSGYNLFGASDVSPGTLSPKNGHMDGWFDEHNVHPSATCEVFEAINFVGGIRNNNPTKYTDDTFSVNEYTLRNVLLHLCQYALEH